MVGGHGEEEDLKTGDPECGQARVVNAVEHKDLQPGHRGPRQHFASVGVVQHVPKKAGSSERLSKMTSNHKLSKDNRWKGKRVITVKIKKWLFMTLQR